MSSSVYLDQPTNMTILPITLGLFDICYPFLTGKLRVNLGLQLDFRPAVHQLRSSRSRGPWWRQDSLGWFYMDCVWLLMWFKMLKSLVRVCWYESGLDMFTITDSMTVWLMAGAPCWGNDNELMLKPGTPNDSVSHRWEVVWMSLPLMPT